MEEREKERQRRVAEKRARDLKKRMESVMACLEVSPCSTL